MAIREAATATARSRFDRDAADASSSQAAAGTPLYDMLFGDEIIVQSMVAGTGTNSSASSSRSADNPGVEEDIG